jgi:hypothetical protein
MLHESGSAMRKVVMSGIAAAAVGLGGVVALPAQAVSLPQSVVVAGKPVSWTPGVDQGAVRAIAQIGNLIVLGGTFTSVTPKGGVSTSRKYIVAFDSTTGALSTTFLPTLDKPVDALVAAPDGQSIYVAGEFVNVNGVRSKSLTRLNIANGAVTAGWKTVAVNGKIVDMKLAGSRLWLGGNFSTIATVSQRALATVNATTGVFDPFMSLAISGLHHGGTTAIQKFDITPDGTKAFVIGNFTSVGGSAHDQAVMLSLSGASAAVANWGTTFFNAACSPAFDSYMRDLDISPDGSYVVVSTTGAYGGSTSPCDSTSRWEMGATGSGQTPTWIDYTGGDTTYAVANTGVAVYVGGHFRWENNAFAGDTPSAGAVPRQGLAALDPANGLPLAWNPGRTRGVGVFDILSTTAGVWFGSDTAVFAGQKHPRIALFPLTGGTAIPSTATLGLPGTVYLGGNATANPDEIVKRTFTGTSAGSNVTVASTGITWSSARGAAYIGDTLYTGWSDGQLYGRTFNGSTFGPAVAMNGMDTLTPLTAFHNDVPNMTAMFFDRGRLYFTLSGSNTLYYRFFTPSSKVVGAVRYTATNTSSAAFSTASGMFLSGGRLYVADKNSGNLATVNFANGVASGSATTVSGPAIDGKSWKGRAIFVGPN